MARWQLSDELKTQYVPMVKEFIDKLEVDEASELSLSNTGLSPYTMKELMAFLGYEEGEMDTNGWQMDFWIPYARTGFKTLLLFGTGITFDMTLKEGE